MIVGSEVTNGKRLLGVNNFHLLLPETVVRGRSQYLTMLSASSCSARRISARTESICF